MPRIFTTSTAGLHKAAPFVLAAFLSLWVAAAQSADPNPAPVATSPAVAPAQPAAQLPAAPATVPAVAPAPTANPTPAQPADNMAGSESTPDIATVEFVPSTAQFTIVKPTAAYVAASADSPTMYPLSPGLPIQAAEESKDEKWVISLTEDGQAAFLPAGDLGPYQPEAQAAITLPDMITGKARVIDTATLSVNGRSVSLFGVIGETGAEADKLQEWISSNGTNVICHLREQAYRCVLANGVDVAREALFNGLARPGTDASNDYLQQADNAKSRNLGLWRAGSQRANAP